MTRLMEARFTQMVTKFFTLFLEGSVSRENLTQTRHLNWVREKLASYPRASGIESTCWRKLNSSTLRRGRMVTTDRSSLLRRLDMSSQQTRWAAELQRSGDISTNSLSM